MINNGNCTEGSAIWSKIKHVITKSHDYEVWFRPKYTTQSAITTLLFILKSNTWMQDFKLCLFNKIYISKMTANYIYK